MEDPQSPKHATTIFNGKANGEVVQQFHQQISTNLNKITNNKLLR
jgi:hypothetical protein